MCFCSYLKPDKQKKSKYKTGVKPKTLNPEFNEVKYMFALNLKKMVPSLLLICLLLLNQQHKTTDELLTTNDDDSNSDSDVICRSPYNDCFTFWLICISHLIARIDWHAVCVSVCNLSNYTSCLWPSTQSLQRLHSD